MCICITSKGQGIIGDLDGFIQNSTALLGFLLLGLLFRTLYKDGPVDVVALSLII